MVYQPAADRLKLDVQATHDDQSSDGVPHGGPGLAIAVNVVRIDHAGLWPSQVECEIFWTLYRLQEAKVRVPASFQS